MLQRIARLAIVAPRRILVVAGLVMVAAAIFGLPVAKSLSAGGFQDPESESARALHLLTDKFGQSDQQMLIVVNSTAAAHRVQAGQAVTDIVEHLKQSPFVFNVSSA
jgi:RND superfamily putative drug exporter